MSPLSERLLEPTHRDKLRVFVCVGSCWRAFGEFPRRSMVCKIDNIKRIGSDSIYNMCWRLRRWQLIEIEPTIAGLSPRLIVTPLGFSVLEELLGYSITGQTTAAAQWREAP